MTTVIVLLLLAVVAVGVVLYLRRGREGGREIRFVRMPGIPGIIRVVAALAALLVLARIFVIIPAGEVGVVQFFGAVKPYVLHEGLRVVNPLARVIRMSVRTQEMKEAANVPSKEGLLMHLETSLLFSLVPAQAPNVYRTYGLRYSDVLISPNMRSMIREVTAEHEAKALYTAGREIISQQVQVRLTRLIGNDFVVKQVLLRDVKPPSSVSDAIERKLRAEQEAEQMQFVLEKERREAERKRIEATGIRDFQRVVAEGITPSLLQWKAIEATEKLAQSPNAKFILSGRGLPVLSTTVER